MKCPFCDSEETSVVETRESREAVTRRRRECSKCTKRFTTYERVELHPLIVIKKNKHREGFDRAKLKIGLLKSCEKRPIPIDKIDSMIDEIETDLRRENKAEIPSKKIGSLIMKKLKKLDKVAYIRFASVYREFEDIDSFEEEVRKLKK